VASLSQGRTAAAQCGLFTHKSVPVIFEPPCNIVKGEKGDLVTDSHSILVKWRDNFSQLLNVHRVKADRNTYSRTTFA